ncbi:ABC transporter permease [Schaalia sp. 19OD2882]|uniref:ABC transporter permease n=1 Tax=Schaalia sp. 19OD2882 TaxID=2794089 RepID=UPI001C1E8FCD|nr:ABC transporter permease [Schaalia sp. 19OD2882]QWW19843.1 ABC transporter permease [Schaalia sp. 19OD2882]
MFLRMLMRALTRRGNRHLLIAVTIALGTAVATSMLSVMFDVGDKVNQELKSYGANIVVRPQGAAVLQDLYGAESPTQAHLREDELGRIKEIFWTYNILDFAPLLPVQVTDATGQSLTLTGTWFDHHMSLATEEKVHTGLDKLRAWWGVTGEWVKEADPHGAMVGHAYAKAHSLSIGDTLTVEREGRKVELTVRGIFDAGDEADSGVYTHLDLAQELLAAPGAVASVEVSALTTPDNDLARKAAKNPDSLSVSERETWYCTAYVSSIAYQIEEVMTDSMARPVRQVAESEGTILEKTQLLMVLVTVLALVASALAIANLVTANVMERSAEIGLMKAIGAKNRSIIALFLAEITLVALVGGVLGYAAGIALAQVIGHIVFSSFVSITPVVAAAALVLVLLVVLGASIPAIRHLLRLNAAEVLHGR